MYINAYKWNLNNDTDEPICWAGREMQRQTMDLRVCEWGGEGGWDKQRVALTYIYHVPNRQLAGSWCAAQGAHLGAQ